MPGCWTAAACTCLTVALHVAEPAIANLTVHDHVQPDRLTGTSAGRHGERDHPAPASGQVLGWALSRQPPR